MSKVWDKVYNPDKTFFGEGPSNFALLCFNYMKTDDVHRILELGSGQGRDSIFFASNGIKVEALDYSTVAIELLGNITRQRRLPISPRLLDVKGLLILTLYIYICS